MENRHWVTDKFKWSELKCPSMKNETVMLHVWDRVIIGRSSPESQLSNTYFVCRQTEGDSKSSGCLCSSKRRSPVKTPRKNWNINCVWWLDGQFLLNTQHTDHIRTKLFFHMVIICSILKWIKCNYLNTDSNKKWHGFNFLFLHLYILNKIKKDLIPRCHDRVLCVEFWGHVEKVLWILFGCSEYAASWLW